MQLLSTAPAAVTCVDSSGARWAVRWVLRRVFRLGLAVLLLGLAGCSGGGDDTAPPPPSEGSATLGAEGGTVNGPDGTVVVVPAGVLAAGTTVRIARDSSGAPALGTLHKPLGAVYLVTPHMVMAGEAASITLPVDMQRYDPSAAPPVVMVAQPGGRWEPLPTGPLRNGSVAAQTLHFSWVTVVQQPAQDVFTQLVLPDSVRPVHPNSPYESSFIADTAATVRVNIRLDGLAFQAPSGGVMCGTPMTIVMELLVQPDSGPMRVIQTTRLGPFTDAASTSYSVPFDYSHSVGRFGPGRSYEIRLTEDCLRVYNLPGLPAVTGGLPYSGVVGFFAVNIQTPINVPAISSQPLPVQVHVGQSASFELGIFQNGDQPGVAWQRSRDGGLHWEGLGVAGTYLTLDNVALADDGALLRAHVCDAVLCVDSWPALLTVLAGPPPLTVALTPAAQNIVAGQSASFVATADGLPAPNLAIYRRFTTSSQKVKDCANLSPCGYNSPPLTVADDGALYYAVATTPGHDPSEAGFSVTSATVSVGVGPVPQAPAVTKPPDAASAIVGGSVGFSAEASGSAPLSWQWQFNGVALADRAATGAQSGISGAASPVLRVSQVQLADAGGYRVVVSNGVNPAATSLAAALTVTLPTLSPTITAQPLAASSTVGGGVSFSVAANGTAPLAYRWRFNGGALSDRAAGAGVAGISGSRSATLVLDNLQNTDAGNYSVVVDNGTPPPATSVDALLTVHGVAPINVPVAVGYAHSCAVGTGGGVACWGQNDFGQLGDGTRVGKASPNAVPGLGGVVAVATGARHSCAVKSDATAVCWGDNRDGELGDGSTVSSLTPVAVAGLTNVKSLAAALRHTCALLTDGSVYCWGNNAEGALGNGTQTSRSTPTQVPGLNGVTALAVAGGHTCVVKSDGSVLCWGWNGAGELGDGTLVARPSPTAVPGLAGVMGVAAAGSSTCAWRADGTAACWGVNGYGQLGDGTLTGRPSPVAVAGLGDVRALAAGDTATCALLPLGNVACWGNNREGELGNGNADQRHPVTIPAFSGVASLAAGGGHACAVKTDGTLWCWGWNVAGQVGDGSLIDRPGPVAVPR